MALRILEKLGYEYLFAGLLDDTFKRFDSALRAITEQQSLAVEKLSVVQRKIKAEGNGEILRGLEGIDCHLKEVESVLSNFKLPTGQAPPPEPKPE